MEPLVIDFETYFDQNINLKKMNYTEYTAATSPILVSTIFRQEIICTPNIKEHLDKLPWDNICVIAHNTLFDALILKHHFGLTAKQYTDTLSMARLLYPAREHGLGDLQKRFIPSAPEKDKNALSVMKGKFWKDLTKEQQNEIIAYCYNDSIITARLYDLWKDQIPEHEQFLIDHTIKTFIEPTLFLDIEKAQIAIDKERQETEQLLTEFNLTTKEIRSDKQFSELLSSKGYTPPVQYSQKQQKLIPAFSANSDAFQRFYEENPTLQNLLDLKRRVNSNIKESRTERLIKATKINRGRIPIGYNYCGAFTGRFSGTNKLNMQNLPRGSILRDAVMAPDGHTLIVYDLSQIEARVLAWVADEQKILDIFISGRDPYSELASEIYGFPVNKHDHPNERFVGKSAMLGLGFSMGAKKFRLYCQLRGSDLPEDFCTLIVEKYRAGFPHIPDLWRLTQLNLYQLYIKADGQINSKLPIKDGCIILPSGRKLVYEGLEWHNNESTWRLPNGKKVYGALIVENFVQGIARDVITHYLEEIHPHYPIVMHTHDELISCVPDDKVEEANKFIAGVMSTPPHWALGLPVGSEGTYGKRYGDCK